MIRYRPATIEDIPALSVIRNNVRENALVSLRLTDRDYVEAFTIDGRAWVAEENGEPVGFVCARLRQRDIWALFLRQSHEGRGIGGALMDLAERWMFSEGVQQIRLSTAPGTRAERLYRRRGWIGPPAKSGDVEVELTLVAR